MVATLGPKLVTATVKMVLSPCQTGFGRLVMETARFALGTTVAATAAALLPGLKSGNEPETDARLVNEPRASALAVIVTVACELAAKPGNTQPISPPRFVHAPCKLTAVRKLMPGGNRFSNVASTVNGPRFVMLCTMIQSRPNGTIEFAAVELRTRSAAGLASKLTELELLTITESSSWAATVAVSVFTPTLPANS